MSEQVGGARCGRATGYLVLRVVAPDTLRILSHSLTPQLVPDFETPSANGGKGVALNEVRRKGADKVRPVVPHRRRLGDAVVRHRGPLARGVT